MTFSSVIAPMSRKPCSMFLMSGLTISAASFSLRSLHARSRALIFVSTVCFASSTAASGGSAQAAVSLASLFVIVVSVTFSICLLVFGFCCCFESFLCECVARLPRVEPAPAAHNPATLSRDSVAVDRSRCSAADSTVHVAQDIAVIWRLRAWRLLAVMEPFPVVRFSTHRRSCMMRSTSDFRMSRHFS